ncbi:MAG: hypothetical protein ACOCRO_06585 [Halanaerobiales bacterium]
MDIKTIYTIIGASGVGKTTICNHLNIPELISHTTRSPREGESQGSPYYFISEEEYKGIKKLEEASYAGNHYCLSKKEVEEKLKDNDKVYVIMEKDGIKQLKNKLGRRANIRIVTIYIHSPLQDIITRLDQNRSKSEMIGRIVNMFETNELAIPSFADYCIINKHGMLEKAVKELKHIVGDN